MRNKIKPKKDGFNRDVTIDLLKCLAILMVIIYHAPLYTVDIIKDPSLLQYARYFFKTILSLCVPLFFFVNGYLLFNKKFDLKKHIYKIIHLIVICGIWGVSKIIILMPIKNVFLSPLEILKALWSWKQGWINSLWFLGALVCIYIFFPILKSVYDHNKKIFLYFTIVCVLFTIGNIFINEIATIFSSLFIQDGPVFSKTNFFNMFNPFRGISGYTFTYFCIGGYTYQFKERILAIRPLKRNIIAVVTMILSCFGLWKVGILYSNINGKTWDVVWNGYDTIFTFINVLCLYVLCLNWKKDNNIIRTISVNTLGIYFIHELFAFSWSHIIRMYPLFTNVPFNILYALVLLFLSLGVCLVMRKIPLIRKLVT